MPRRCFAPRTERGGGSGAERWGGGGDGGRCSRFFALLLPLLRLLYFPMVGIAALLHGRARAHTHPPASLQGQMPELCSLHGRTQTPAQPLLLPLLHWVSVSHTPDVLICAVTRPAIPCLARCWAQRCTVAWHRARCKALLRRAGWSPSDARVLVSPVPSHTPWGHTGEGDTWLCSCCRVQGTKGLGDKKLRKSECFCASMGGGHPLQEHILN